MKWLAATGLLLVVAACGGSQSASDEVLVSAAVSLIDAFGESETAFEASNPGFDVLLNFGSSSSLREQILEGAPVDVFASANPSNMAQVIDAGASDRSTTFAINALQIAVPVGNPAGIAGLTDFADPELLIGLCASGVPCGDFARQALEAAGVVPSLDTEEPDVKALLTKIEAGELDAGIVYVTDVLASGAVDGIEIPDEFNVLAEYHIAVMTEAPNPGGAEAFVNFVLSAMGQAILQSYGFESP